MYIYGLSDPRNDELRYIGFTSKSLQERFERGHLSSTGLKKTNHKNSWIKSLLSIGLKPDIFLIQETNNDDWKFDEQWNIEYFKSIGCRLTNIAPGGRGSIGYKHTTEAKQRIGIASKGNSYALGVKASDITKKRMSDTKKILGIKPNPTPEQRAANSKITGDKLRGIPRPLWVRNKIGKSHIGLRPSESTKKRLSDFNKMFTQKDIDNMFNEYVLDQKLSMSKLAKNYNVVTSVMFNILHEIKYKCSDVDISRLAKIKLNKRSVRKRN